MYTTRFELWPFHLDMTGCYPLAQIASRMIHTAGQHADYKRFGIKDLNLNGYTWVLHRLSVSLPEPVKIGVPLDISTGVLNRDGMVTRRIFVLSQGDRVIGTGMSHWVAIDVERRRPVPIATVLTDGRSLTPHPDMLLPEIPKRIIDPEEEDSFSPAFDHTVRYSDLDLNRHVNTAVWIAMAMDAIPIERHSTRFVRHADLHFVAEGLYGRLLKVYHLAHGGRDKVRIKGDEDGKDAFVLALDWGMK